MSEPTEARGPARRRARTRSALLQAARGLLVERRTDASIEEITKRAGVGFGSFFNHFPGGKSELFDAAVFELLDVYAGWVASVTEGVDDPAEVFARSFRLTGRLALAEPGLLAPLLVHGPNLLFTEGELRSQAIADLDAGLAAGRFVAAPVQVHLVAVGSLLIGLVALVHRSEVIDGLEIDEGVVDATAAAALRALGVDGLAAHEICSRPLPDLVETLALMG